jgi:hypothetical protein
MSEVAASTAVDRVFAEPANLPSLLSILFYHSLSILLGIAPIDLAATFIA